MTSPNGLWEHALYSEPRVDHGFCTDDNARAMILLNGEREVTPTLSEASRIYVRFVRDAALPAGGFHNRRRADGSWADSVGSDDSQGRAIWALGSMVHFGSESSIREMGMELFLRQNFVSPSPRANAFAVLGASEILAADPTHEHARNRIQEWVAHIRVPEDSQWPWPESRLAYDNARIPEALIAAGVALGIDSMIRDGLSLLDWLVGSETMDDHFSFTPAGGWAPGESRPGFDQQPVEAAAFADACDRAWEITGDSKWRDHVLRACRWFVGDNDRQVVLYDHETGAGYDGLTQGGANLNQGAESTLAALSTLQKAAKYS
ncbi:MAG: glycosyltransferase [Acidimicrobiia bacterium]|nr:glycosyltransferase [Acidimicrobiia bacterium]